MTTTARTPPHRRSGTYVSRLRQALPEPAREWIETESSGYRFAAPSAQIEHLRFAALRREARIAREAPDVETASELLDEAMGLWRGDPFREIEHLDWARPLIEQLHLDRLEVLEERWEVALAPGAPHSDHRRVGGFHRRTWLAGASGASVRVGFASKRSNGSGPAGDRQSSIDTR